MLRYLADENFNNDIVTGLRLREPTGDISRVQDEAIREGSDPEVIAWAAQHSRIVLTHDKKTFTRFVTERLLGGEHSAGVFVVSNRLQAGLVIDDLLTAHLCTDLDPWVDVVEHLPF